MKTSLNGRANGHAKGRKGIEGAPVADGLSGRAAEPTPAPEKPTAAVGNGRDASGRFAPGTKLGRGNPHNRRRAALRTAFLSVATEERMKEPGEEMYATAIGGA
jgi:hypothetical protein